MKIEPLTQEHRNDRLRCYECGHEQTVQSAASALVGTTLHFWFGSAYDHCNKCDGPMEVLAVNVPEELK